MSFDVFDLIFFSAFIFTLCFYVQALARSMQQQADSTAKFADTIALMAENETKRNDILERIVENNHAIFQRMIENDRERNVLLSTLTRLLETTLPKQQ